ARGGSEHGGGRRPEHPRPRSGPSRLGGAQPGQVPHGRVEDDGRGAPRRGRAPWTIRLTRTRDSAHYGSVRERNQEWSAAGLLLGAGALLAVSVCVCVALTWGHTDIDDGLSWFGTLGR